MLLFLNSFIPLPKTSLHIKITGLFIWSVLLSSFYFFFSPVNIYLSNEAIAPLFSLSKVPSTSSKMSKEGFFYSWDKVIFSVFVMDSSLANNYLGVLSSDALIIIGL